MESAPLWAVTKVKVLCKCRCLSKGYVQHRSQAIGTEKQGSVKKFVSMVENGSFLVRIKI
ncbi:hypothetical protein AMURIS_03233 [Acetatifactor muris]|uniref:Uncharacterized protein n=1 Tax=Acetatifactor muris TaxID=879566 RepID=A0A2K4ZJC3_9FIRM|nr:hypothetical protein AMURIS_03233 [Acetatifactor muris]